MEGDAIIWRQPIHYVIFINRGLYFLFAHIPIGGQITNPRLITDISSKNKNGCINLPLVFHIDTDCNDFDKKTLVSEVHNCKCVVSIQSIAEYNPRSDVTVFVKGLLSYHSK